MVLHIGLNDLRLTWKDSHSLIWMLLLPAFLMWMFSSMQFGSASAGQVALALQDNDGDWLAAAFADELADQQLAITSLQPGAPRQGQETSRTLVIPRGFTQGVLAGEQQTIRLEKESGSASDYDMAAEVHVLRTVIRSIGRLVELKQAGLLEQENQGASQAFAALAHRRPLVDVAVGTAGVGNPVPAGQAQSVPGILVMTVLMMTVIYGGIFLSDEKRSGMLQRQMTLPLGRRHVIMGKLLGRLIIAAAQTMVLLATGKLITWLFMGEPLSYGNSLPGLVLLISAYCFACTGLAMLLGAVLGTPEQASSVGWLVSMALAALGGCWWPAEITPSWLQKAAHVLPTAWAMDGFHALISFGYGLSGVILPSVALLGFGLLFSMLGIRFLKVGR